MTTAQKHAARLREYAADQTIEPQEREDLLAGAEALEAQGEWRIMVRGGEPYLVPAADYKQAIESPDLIGSAVDASDVTVTGWRRT